MSLEDLINKIDAVEFISQYMELEEKNGEYWGLSPFKDENTPSFSIRKETNRFYDFSSGIGGNVFTFTKKFHQCSSADAVKILEQYIGEDFSASTCRQKMAATVVCKKYMRNVKSRGSPSSKHSVYPDNYMSRYEKRQSKLSEWAQEGISENAMTRFEVYYDAFSDRIVYPLRNIHGKIQNIGGRTLDPDWKEKGLRKYTYFSGWNGELNLIYGLFENMEHILEQKEIIIFEGCKSVLLAYSWGIKNTGAILTSHLNPHQMKILARLGVKVVFALDNDVDIRQDHNINKLKNYTVVSYIHDTNGVLDEKDAPVDKGIEVFNHLYKQSRNVYCNL